MKQKTPLRQERSLAPRKTTTVRLDMAHVEWMDKHLPRSVSVSAFVNDALGKEIARQGRR